MGNKRQDYIEWDVRHIPHRKNEHFRRFLRQNKYCDGRCKHMPCESFWNGLRIDLTCIDFSWPLMIGLLLVFICSKMFLMVYQSWKIFFKTEGIEIHWKKWIFFLFFFRFDYSWFECIQIWKYRLKSQRY